MNSTIIEVGDIVKRKPEFTADRLWSTNAKFKVTSLVGRLYIALLPMDNKDGYLSGKYLASRFDIVEKFPYLASLSDNELSIAELCIENEWQRRSKQSGK